MDSAPPSVLILASVVALAASTLGSLSGFGTGLILSLFLVPLIGATNVIPVIAVASLLNNLGRTAAFRREIDWHHAQHLLSLGLPACIAGAYCYTLLSATWITVLLACALLFSVLLRRRLAATRLQLSPLAERVAGAGFGFVNGGVIGAGVILIAILLSLGLSGKRLVGTDALISLVMGVARVILFGSVATLNPPMAALGLLVGLFTVPGAFIARALFRHISTGVHSWIMEAVVVVGAIIMLKQALG